MTTQTQRARWRFSNFGPIPGGMRGYESDDTWRYPTLEHAFQAAKTLDLAARDRIAAATSPGRAKQLGQQVPLRDGWNRMRVDVMRTLLAQKWSAEPFRAQLLATGDDLFVEWTTWHDTYWGQCLCPRHNGQGQNHLGRLLEELRAELVAEAAAST